MKLIALLFVAASVCLVSVESRHYSQCKMCPRRYCYWGYCFTYNYPCPVHGGWSDYTEWKKIGNCSKECGGGLQKLKRDRTCTNPEAKCGGKMCTGSSFELNGEICNDFRCPQDVCNEAVTGYRAHPNPQEPGKFLQCVDKKVYIKDCDKVLVWKQKIMSCDWKEKVCKQGTYHPHSTDKTKYMHCSNGDSQVMACADGTKWDQAMLTCVTDDGDQGNGNKCKEANAMFADDKKCGIYYQCVGKTPVQQNCPPGLGFNDKLRVCSKRC